MILHNIGRAHFLSEEGGGNRYYIHWIHNTKTGRVHGYPFHYPFGYPGQKIPGNPSTKRNIVKQLGNDVRVAQNIK